MISQQKVKNSLTVEQMILCWSLIKKIENEKLFEEFVTNLKNQKVLKTLKLRNQPVPL